ncbi:MAG: hypothetical protein F6K16_30740, partial [Symploca sp. SIO2B6]|nr:hypothetical protein [Symploca sp. SIO2B6]
HPAPARWPARRLPAPQQRLPQLRQALGPGPLDGHHAARLAAGVQQAGLGPAGLRHQVRPLRQPLPGPGDARSPQDRRRAGLLTRDEAGDVRFWESGRGSGATGWLKVFCWKGPVDPVIRMKSAKAIAINPNRMPLRDRLDHLFLSIAEAENISVIATTLGD